MTPETRVYQEAIGESVVMVTVVCPDEIRYAVVSKGMLLFNKAIEGKYSARLAQQISREQEEVAHRAAREVQTNTVPGGSR